MFVILSLLEFFKYTWDVALCAIVDKEREKEWVELEGKKRNIFKYMKFFLLEWCENCVLGCWHCVAFAICHLDCIIIEMRPFFLSWQWMKNVYVHRPKVPSFSAYGKCENGWLLKTLLYFSFIHTLSKVHMF